MLPASGWSAPLRIFIKVLLPAPFSPMTAWTSPRATSRETLLRARVAPKLLSTPVTRSRGTAIISDMVQRRVEQLFDFRRIHVFRSGYGDTSVDPFGGLFPS